MPLTKEILKKYYNPVFIETGTFMGAGVLIAIELGFKEIYSIELSDFYYERNLPFFKDFPNVHLFHGDSKIILPEILKGINDPCTFWLDAHYSEQGTADNGSPLLGELKAIYERNVKDDIIMIDDLDSYTTGIEIINNILICRNDG